MSPESKKDASEAERSVSGDRLEVRGPGGVISYVGLSSPRLLIGRAADCQVRLNDPAVSRRHAELFRDPFGRWWIHDLGSRNATRVDGVVVVERVLGLSDAVEIGPFALRLQPSTSVEGYTAADTSKTAPISEGDFERISTETEAKGAKLAAVHLSEVMAFGRRLLEIDQADRRLRELCRLMVGPELQGRMAVAMRLVKGRAGEEPVMLCEPEICLGSRQMTPYISRGLLRRVREQNEPVLGSNTGRGRVDVELTVSKEEMPISAVACPLRSDDRTIDFLYLLLPPELGTNEWLALASLAAGELQKAEFAWAARRQAEDHAAIDHELEQAREIQMRLVPRDVNVAGLDVAIGFEPCRWVGGDYVDVLPTADGRVLLTVGDVCGKGLHAAMVAASVHSMVHAGASAGLTLRDLVQHLNEYLCDYLPGHSFVTMIAAVLDPKTGKMEAVNAGHPPGVILDRAGGLRWLQVGANLPLGIGSAAIECRGTHIEADEMLALFTDGLTESYGREGDRVGLEPLAKELCALYASEGVRQARGVADRLSSMLSDVRGQGLASDDQTFLLARRV